MDKSVRENKRYLKKHREEDETDQDNISVNTIGCIGEFDRKSNISKQPSTNTVKEGVKRFWSRITRFSQSSNSHLQAKEDKAIERFNAKVEQLERKVDDGTAKVLDLEHSMTVVAEKVGTVERKVDTVNDNVSQKKLVEENLVLEANKTLHAVATMQQTAATGGHEYIYFLMFSFASKIAAPKWRTFVKCMMSRYPTTFVDTEIECLRTKFKNDDKMKVQEFLWRWKIYFASQEQLVRITDIIQAALIAVDPKKSQKGFDMSSIVKLGESNNAACFTEGYIMYLAGQFPSEWKIVGIELGFNNDELKVIEKDNSGDLKNTVFTMLMKWKKREGGSDHLLKGKLMTAFMNANRVDLAEKIGGQKIPIR